MSNNRFKDGDKLEVMNTPKVRGMFLNGSPADHIDLDVPLAVSPQTGLILEAAVRLNPDGSVRVLCFHTKAKRGVDHLARESNLMEAINSFNLSEVEARARMDAKSGS